MLLFRRIPCAIGGSTLKLSSCYNNHHQHHVVLKRLYNTTTTRSNSFLFGNKQHSYYNKNDNKNGHSSRGYSNSNQSSDQQHKIVGMWLLICGGLVFVMVVLGGVTRLTESGLSITEWKPITGSIPPLSEADWETEFAKYKQSPEYQK